MNSGAIPTWLWMFIVGRCSLAPPVVDISLFFLRGIIRFVKWLERCSLQSKTGAYYPGFERVTAASGVESARLNDWFVGSIPIARSMILLMQLAFPPSSLKNSLKTL
jgi:hypothetical protein